jgi:hypothetical protein
MHFCRVSSLFWLGVLSCIYSCKSPKQISAKTKDSVKIPKVIIQSGFEAPLTVDYSIDSAKVSNDSILTIFVKYKGCCNGLHFELYNDGNIMKSMPPKTNLVLVHRTERENCKNETVSVLNFNLSPLKYVVPENNKIILRLTNWKGKLEYQ